MEKIKRKIQNLKKIRLFSYVYLNHFCSRIERNGKGRIIPYKNAVIDLEKDPKYILGMRIFALV